MDKKYILLFSLIVLLLFSFQISSVLAYSRTELSYQEFRADLMHHNYQLEESVVTGEFHFLQQLHRVYPTESYHALFERYLMLHTSYLVRTTLQKVR